LEVTIKKSIKIITLFSTALLISSAKTNCMFDSISTCKKLKISKRKKNKITKEITKDFDNSNNSKCIQKLVILTGPHNRIIANSVIQKMEKDFDVTNFNLCAADLHSQYIGGSHAKLNRIFNKVYVAGSPNNVIKNMFKKIFGYHKKKIGILVFENIETIYKKNPQLFSYFLFKFGKNNPKNKNSNMLAICTTTKPQKWPDYTYKVCEVINCCETKDDKLNKKDFNNRVEYLVNNLI